METTNNDNRAPIFAISRLLMGIDAFRSTYLAYIDLTNMCRKFSILNKL
jgi:hypothetical protein